jgi:hypothetical protein
MEEVPNRTQGHASTTDETASILLDLHDKTNALFIARALNFSFQIEELEELFDPVHGPHRGLVFSVEVIQRERLLFATGTFVSATRTLVFARATFATRGPVVTSGPVVTRGPGVTGTPVVTGTSVVTGTTALASLFPLLWLSCSLRWLLVDITTRAPSDDLHSPLRERATCSAPEMFQIELIVHLTRVNFQRLCGLGNCGAHVLRFAGRCFGSFGYFHLFLLLR